MIELADDSERTPVSVALERANDQLPSRTSWGYSVRLATHATASSARNDVDPADLVFELFARDGAEPSAFVVARSIEVRR